MIVVAGATPIRYLVVIERALVAGALRSRADPSGCCCGGTHPESTPDVVRAWLDSRPNWLEIRQPIRPLPSEADLDRGEREAIALAEEVAAGLLLVDEWDARLEAERRHSRVVGTLRVLADGASRGLTDLEEAFERLRHTNFRVHPELLESLLEEYRRGKHE